MNTKLFHIRGFYCTYDETIFRYWSGYIVDLRDIQDAQATRGCRISHCKDVFSQLAITVDEFHNM